MKRKLNLNQLKINSFVTDLKDEKANTVKAGIPPYTDFRCPAETDDCETNPVYCENDYTDYCYTWNIYYCY